MMPSTKPRHPRFFASPGRGAAFVLGLAAALALFLPPAARADETSAPRLTGHLELGFLAVASHRIQFSNDGTYFPIRTRAGRSTCSPSAG